MELVEITDRTRELDPSHYEQIEEGRILFFPQMPVELPEEDRRSLLRQRQTDSPYYKNIAYRPAQDIVTGVARGSDREELRRLAASPYDTFMKRFHDFLKENQRFQETCRKERIEFPPRSSWLVFTDMISHAVLGGQFALEQTFIVSRRAMQRPEQAPVSVLERLAGVPLTWRD